MRSQLKDSSRQLEDQNLKFCRLESKLRDQESQMDRQVSAAKEAAQTIKDLKVAFYTYTSKIIYILQFLSLSAS